MLYKRFKVVKEIVDKGEKIPIGSEITIMDDRIYFNGGQIMPGVYDLFRQIIEREMTRPNFLREIPIPYNKC